MWGEGSCCLTAEERQHTLSTLPPSLRFHPPKSVCTCSFLSEAFPTLTPHWGPLLMVITPNCFPLAHQAFPCLPEPTVLSAEKMSSARTRSKPPLDSNPRCPRSNSSLPLSTGILPRQVAERHGDQTSGTLPSSGAHGALSVSFHEDVSTRHDLLGLAWRSGVSDPIALPLVVWSCLFH